MSFSAREVILGPGEGKVVRIPGHPYVIKASSDDTGGVYALAEATITGAGPPQHIHSAEEEAFYILEGQVDVLVGEQTVHGVVGSFILIPRGTVHTFWNAGSAPARLLVIIAPPGVEKHLAEIVGDEDVDTATFVERTKALGPKLDMQVVGPPLG